MHTVPFTDPVKERPVSYALPRRKPQCQYVGCAGVRCRKDAVRDTSYCTTHNQERPSETTDRNWTQTEYANEDHPLYDAWKDGVFEQPSAASVWEE